MQHLYRHFDKGGTLLYVGISLSAIQRLAQHKDASHWFNEISSVTIEQYETREAALAAERSAIVNENPLHNLKRPKPTEIKKADSFRRAEDSRNDLLRRLVQFNPTYSMSEARAVLKCGQAQLKRWIENGKIGSVQVGSRKLITGWQLIEFIEYMEKEGHVF